MAKYTTIATITEVKKDCIIRLKGCGKYIYEKDVQTKWLVLEGNSANDSKFLEETTDFIVDMGDEIQKAVIASAMINKKTLELAVEKTTSNGNTRYSIISIKNP